MVRYRTIAFVFLSVCVIAFVVAVGVGSEGTEDGRLVHFDFEAESVTDDAVLDASGDGNHGEIVGGDRTHTADDVDGAIHFDGDSHLRIDLEDRPLAGDFTVVVEVRNGHQEYFAGIVSTDSWRVVAPYDRYGFYTTDAGIDSRAYEGEDWRHLTAVHRDGTFEFYVDGEFVDDLEVDHEFSSETIHVGQRPGSHPLTGEVSEVQIYDRAVSPAEVNALYAGQTGVNPVLASDHVRLTTSVLVVLIGFAAAWYELIETRHE